MVKESWRVQETYYARGRSRQNLHYVFEGHFDASSNREVRRYQQVQKRIRRGMELLNGNKGSGKVQLHSSLAASAIHCGMEATRWSERRNVEVSSSGRGRGSKGV